ncbi:MAG: LysR family transcriptional regulator [Enterococcus sp.]
MFQLLQTFISVYETKNFTHTAEELFLSQPTVSSQIKKLELQLGVTLFYRNGKQEIIPTTEADFLYPRFLQILEEWQDATGRVVHPENFREHCLIACSHTCAIYFLPKLMPQLMEKFPMVDFDILMMNSEEAKHQMEQNKVDLSFVEKATRSDGLFQTPVYKDELVLAGPKTTSHWLLREHDSGLRFYNELYLQQQNLNPAIIHVNNNEAIVALLKEGVGRAVISKLSLTDGIEWEPLTENNFRKFYLLSHKTVFREILNEIAHYMILLSTEI